MHIRSMDPLDTVLSTLQETWKEACTYVLCSKERKATLRIIIEQSTVWQTPLLMNFIDFEKAFDSVDKNVICILTHHYGIPAPLVTLIQQMHEKTPPIY